MHLRYVLWVSKGTTHKECPVSIVESLSALKARAKRQEQQRGILPALVPDHLVSCGSWAGASSASVFFSEKYGDKNNIIVRYYEEQMS